MSREPGIRLKPGENPSHAKGGVSACAAGEFFKLSLGVRKVGLLLIR